MVNKIAFIIPTYPPHFNYAKNFLETFRKNSLNLQADLFFIFSDESEAQEFGEYEYKIILPDELRIFENGGIINIKKFFAYIDRKSFKKEVISIKNIIQTLFVWYKDLDKKICIVKIDKNIK